MFALLHEPYHYSINLQLNNMIAYTSRAELEAALVLHAAGRQTRNVDIANMLSNLQLTYGSQAVIDAARLMGFCVLDKAS
jgi:hypothetical protein